MAAKPVQISIDVELLAQVDADPDTRRQGRSAFVRAAIERHLAAKRRRQIDDQIARAYGKKPQDVDDPLIGAQSWPAD